jgi:PTH1 family peptidyl-tRNA hydrolase
MFRRKRPPPASTDRWLVVGLGNPGREYESSRHNFGFLVIDELARRHGGRVTARAARSLTASVRLDDRELILAKPQTFMNLSGEAVKRLRAKYVVPLDRTLVIHDELDLPFGRLRVRRGGSSAGNHGLDSIITALGTVDFARFRVGIGRPPGDGADYVLSPFTEDERRQVPEIVARVADAVEVGVRQGVDRAMTDFNRSS